LLNPLTGIQHLTAFQDRKTAGTQDCATIWAIAECIVIFLLIILEKSKLNCIFVNQR